MGERLILITNDDGIHAAGLRALAAALHRLGRVVTIAPDREQSATSHALTLHRPLRVRALGDACYAVQGTPTDCVLMAVRSLLGRHPDLVVSGINDGPNMGEDVNYSGTVAAAIEGSLLGVPAMAVSLGKEAGRDFDAAARIAARLAAALLERQAPWPPENELAPVAGGSPGEATAAAGGAGAGRRPFSPRRQADRVVLNVNVPGGSPERIGAVRLTRLGKRVYRDAIIEKTDPRGQRYYWIGGEEPTWLPEHDNGIMTDFRATQLGFVSVTPLKLDWTDYDRLEELGGWRLGE